MLQRKGLFIAFLIFFGLFRAPLAFAGREGGGGHPCKLAFMAMAQSLDIYFQESLELSNRYPFWKELVDVANPEINLGFSIVIAEKPIDSCRNTSNALACAHPEKNTLELYCGQGGWDNQKDEDKLTHALHELFWWLKDKDDSNYFYSLPLAKDIIALGKYQNRMKLIVFGYEHDEITRAETAFTKVDCKLMEYTRKVPGGYKSPSGYVILYCGARGALYINGKYFGEPQILTVPASRQDFSGPLDPDGEFFVSDEEVESYFRAKFNLVALDLLDLIDRVSKRVQKYESGKCYVSQLLLAVDSFSNKMIEMKERSVPVTCR